MMLYQFLQPLTVACLFTKLKATNVKWSPALYGKNCGKAFLFESVWTPNYNVSLALLLSERGFLR